MKLFLFSILLAASNMTWSKEGIKHEYQKDEITKLCDLSIEKAKIRIEKIKALPKKRIHFRNSTLALDNILANLNDETSPLTFMAYVSKDADLREEGSACEEKIGQYYPTITSDKKLYEVLKLAKAHGKNQKRLQKETLLSFEKNGMNLSDDKLVELNKLNQELASLSAKFSLNLNNDTSNIEVTAQELDGVSDSFLGRLRSSPDGKYIVTTKSTDFIQVMENAHSAETRKKMLFAYENRAGVENTKLLEDAILVRQKIASLLGFETWADAQINGRMAKDSKTVLEFLNGLKAKLTDRKNEDLDAMLAYKKSIDPQATKVETWDIRYLAQQIKKEKYSLDDELIAEYFPANTVMQGMFEIYSTLLQVEFEEVKNASVWAEGVKLYRIYNLGKKSKPIAYFYADVIPRAGKYGHAAAFTIISGRMLGKAHHHPRYSVPVSSIVANFTPPNGDKPSLLSHDEVETLFHEFGHIMHQTLTRAPFASLSGTSVSRDFVEAPSQMLENWVWDKEMLQKISGHYKNPEEKLPEDLMQKMLAAKNFNQGYAYMRQLLFGLFDMKIHSTNGPVDVTKTFDELYEEYIGVAPLEGGHFAAGFGHMMGGYDAGYYGYLWSEVYAQDMFSVFEEKGLLSKDTGLSYRKNILEKGSMEDALELLKKFLGRDPNANAFYKKLGIKNI